MTTRDYHWLHEHDHHDDDRDDDGFYNPRVVKWNGMLWICPEPYHKAAAQELWSSALRRGSPVESVPSARSGAWYSKYWTFNCTPIEQLNVCERQNTRTNGQHGLITLSGPFLFSFPFPFTYTHSQSHSNCDSHYRSTGSVEKGRTWPRGGKKAQVVESTLRCAI